MNISKRTLLFLGLVIVLLPQAAISQGFLFDQGERDVRPGESFSLQLSLNSGMHDINLWLLYLNTNSSQSFITATGANLDPMWEYFGDPEWPIVVPIAPTNSTELGLAFPAAPAVVPAGTWRLATFTLLVSETATLGSFQLATTPDSAFFDGADNEIYPTLAVLNLNVVPEPSVFVLLITGGLLTLSFRARR